MRQGGDEVEPLPEPPAPAISAATVGAGPPIPPIQRIRLFDDTEWEHFVLEWAESLKDRYADVVREGGAGDLGRDVIATKTDSGWDNYQCKHLAAPLAPSDVWLELGKVIYHTYLGGYEAPDAYYFVAPQGAGPKLSNLLRKAADLRAGLIENWSGYCESKITSTAEVPLEGDFLACLNDFDFGIFKSLAPNTLIDGHSQTKYHVARFGGGLPPRPDPAPPPAEPTSEEAPYVRALLDAYAEHLGEVVDAPQDLAEGSALDGHFAEARREFYSAEALRTFSRDRLPPGAFEDLQSQVHHGVGDTLRDEHADGYRRVLAVVALARNLTHPSHALYTSMVIQDHGGICHQLANDGTIEKWVN